MSIHHVYSPSCYPLYFIHFILVTYKSSVDMTFISCESFFFNCYFIFFGCFQNLALRWF